MHEQAEVRVILLLYECLSPIDGDGSSICGSGCWPAALCVVAGWTSIISLASSLGAPHTRTSTQPPTTPPPPARLVVVLERRVYVHALPTLAHLRTIEVAPNPRGLAALAPCEEPCLLALPSSDSSGALRVYDLLREGGAVLAEVEAHRAPLAALAWNSDGSLLASASSKGTVIRAYRMPGAAKAFTFRRGTYPAVIHSLTFSPAGVSPPLLAAASSHGTVHVFRLEELGRWVGGAAMPHGWRSPRRLARAAACHINGAAPQEHASTPGVQLGFAHCGPSFRLQHAGTLRPSPPLRPWACCQRAQSSSSLTWCVCRAAAGGWRRDAGTAWLSMPGRLTHMRSGCWPGVLPKAAWKAWGQCCHDWRHLAPCAPILPSTQHARPNF